MKIVVAPQAFKGSLPATGVAAAMTLGLRRVIPDADIVEIPLADGGEGTVETMIAATGGELMTAAATGPLGDPVDATWGILGDGKTAVIEMAAASGIGLVRADRLDPLSATSYGTGELILAALEGGCRDIVVGLGGSATNDAGAGMAQALGARLLDRRGRKLTRGGAALADLARIDITRLDRRLALSRVSAACDVTNRLLGRNGASWVYGPQKGANAEMCRQLDDALANFAAVVERDLGVDVGDIPGAGAAGGLGAGLIAFLGARLMPGIDVISDAVKLTERLEGAGLVLTGEGRLDGQTLSGKTVAGVAARARARGIPVVAIAGQLSGNLTKLRRRGVSAALSIAPGPITLDEAVDDAARLIADAAERAIRLVLIDPSPPPSTDR
jgi:glycerate kinase